MGLLALLWGSAFLWIELALEGGLSPGLIAVLRCGLGGLVLLVLCRFAGRQLPRDRRTWGRITVAAFFCNALPFALFAVGQQSVDSGLAGVLNATTPLWSLLIGLGIGSERGIRPLRVGGLLLGFAGTLLIFAPWQHGGLIGGGTLAILAAALSYAVAFAYMGRKLTGAGVDPLALSAAQLLTATALGAAALPFSGPGAGPVSASGLVAVVVLGIFATGFTFALTNRLIAEEGATTAASVGYLLPVVSVGLGAVVLDEEIGVRVAAGAVVVLAGVAMTRRTAPLGPAAGRGAIASGNTGDRSRTDGPDIPGLGQCRDRRRPLDDLRAGQRPRADGALEPREPRRDRARRP
jgi:drug/metabolite transporter (DMT)-like permease